MKEELKDIGRILRKEEMDFTELSDVLTRYKTIVHSISDIQLDSKSQLNSLHFENGMALGAAGAAKCLDDKIRTKVFVKGLFEAIEGLKIDGKSPVHILYAGCGPFATLVLPILASYSPDEVKCTLLEINTESYESVQNVIEIVGFSDHVSEFIQADATKVQLNQANKIDIIISETMQRALETEQQVPIVINLLNQVREDVILIPAKIAVTACLMDMEKLDKSVVESDYCERLGTVIELSKAEMKLKPYDVVENNHLHFNEKTFPLEEKMVSRFDQLGLLTEIHVYGNNWLLPYQSGLTVPKIIELIEREPQSHRAVKMQYIVDQDPKTILQKIV